MRFVQTMALALALSLGSVSAFAAVLTYPPASYDRQNVYKDSQPYAHATPDPRSVAPASPPSRWIYQSE